MKVLIYTAIALLSLTATAQVDTSKKITGKDDSVRVMQDVIISGMVSSKVLREQPGNISVIDARPFYSTNLTGIELLRQTSGIKVKQSAGYGSNVEYFINGSTGKQVKYFIDGLPQDNLGETQGLNILPVEQTERIEVYKGVLPVDLGADALGAAINIVTRKERENYVNASYAISSFNTHRLNVSGKKYFTKSFFAGIQTAVSSSENNYKIDAEVFDRNGNPYPVTARRFHDAFGNYSLRVESGWMHTRWADQATFSLVSTGLSRQLQSNLVMTQPYGKALYKEALWSGIAKYAKQDLFKNLSLSAFGSFNYVRGLFTDTSRNVYNWLGDITDKNSAAVKLFLPAMNSISIPKLPPAN